MIEIEELSKIYQLPSGPVTALRDISLSIPKGEAFGIIGESGAGKSSLIRCMNLIERPTEGRVLVEGMDLTQLSPKALRHARHNIGMIFQYFNLLSGLTVFGNIALSLELMGTRKSEIAKRVNPLLELTGLSDKRDRYPHQLSGGQKQRVAIARALATQPKILLCDEATSALDSKTTRSILELLKQIQREFDLTLVFITHHMDVIKMLCDQVALIDKGRIIESSAVVDFFIKPQTGLGKRFVSDALKQGLSGQLRQRIKEQQNRNTTGFPLLRISFDGVIATQPLVYELIHRFDLEINILQANIEEVSEHIVGVMVVEVMTAKEEPIKKAIQFLEEKGVYVEVIGYVA